MKLPGPSLRSAAACPASFIQQQADATLSSAAPGNAQLAATTADNAQPVPTMRVINGSPPGMLSVR